MFHFIAPFFDSYGYFRKYICDLTFDRVDVLSDGACLGPHRTQLVRNSVHVAFDAVRN